MPWLAWVFVLMLPVVLALLSLLSLIEHWLLSRKIKEKKAQIASVETELALLEALTPSDRAWLARSGLVDNPRTYAPPAVDSVWEWQTGTPMAREVVTVSMVVAAVSGETGSVLLVGPAGEQWVSLAEFAENAQPAPLGRHR